MSIDIVDTLKSAFGSLNTDTGRKVVGLLLGLQVLNLTVVSLQAGGFALAAASAVLQLALGIIGLIVTLGVLRSFSSMSLEKEQYTENLLWPVIRYFGANTSTTLFALGIAALGLVPAAIAAAGVTGVGAIAPQMVTGASIIGVLIGLVGGVLGVALFAYIYSTLVVSLPMIAADDKRLFEALDTSIQRTKGSRMALVASLVLLILVFLSAVVAGGILVAVLGMVSERVAGILAFAGYLLVSALFSASFLSLLTEFNERLP